MSFWSFALGSLLLNNTITNTTIICYLYTVSIQCLPLHNKQTQAKKSIQIPLLSITVLCFP